MPGQSHIGQYCRNISTHPLAEPSSESRGPSGAHYGHETLLPMTLGKSSWCFVCRPWEFQEPTGERLQRGSEPCPGHSLLTVEATKALDHGICRGFQALRLHDLGICGNHVIWNGIETDLFISRPPFYIGS